MGWVASDIADWWDEQHRQSKAAMDKFVDDNPNLFGIIVGTAIVSVMELGAGMVDVLRFGQGAAEGGVGGYGKDALRLIGILGPLGKVAKYVNIGRSARLTRLIVDPGGNGLCAWVNSAMAFTKTATKLKGSASVFTTVEDVAAALGKHLQELGGISLSDRIAMLRELGAKIGPYRRISTLSEIAKLARNDGSVVLISLKGVRQGVEGGHAIIAYRDVFGRLRFLDRGGIAGKMPEVFASLQDLAAKYRITGNFEPHAGAVMENVFVRVVGGIPELAMPVFFATQAVGERQNETIAQAFEIHKKIVEAGPRILETAKSHRHTVVTGDWLSKIARHHYGDMHKWPIIYVANRHVIGADPNLIKPGLKLLIPELPNVPKTGNRY